MRHIECTPDSMRVRTVFQTPSVLATFLLPRRNTETKATYRQRSLLACTVSEGESVTIMGGAFAWQQAGRHGTGAVAESFYLI